MRATIMYGAGDVRVETVPDAQISESTDALVRITRSCICGSDLWPYNQMEHEDAGRPMGHEFIGIVEAVGADVRKVKAGDLVVVPFAYSDGRSRLVEQIDAWFEAFQLRLRRLLDEPGLTLEFALEFIEDDELVEVTPKSIRLRKKILNDQERKVAAKKPAAV